MKFNYKQTMLVGLAFLTISAFWQLYDFTIPLILKNTFKINDAIAGFIMSFDNIIALFLLPLFGTLSDKTQTKIGRRTPYIIAGTIASVIFMMIIPYAAHKQNLAVFITSLFFVLISMAVYRSPSVALMPDVTPKPLRSKGNAVINLMGTIGGALFLMLNSFLAPDTRNPETANYWPIFISTAVIMLAGTLVLILTVNEPKMSEKMRQESAAMGIDPEDENVSAEPAYVKEKLQKDVRKSMFFILISVSLWYMGYNAITSAFSKYAINALGMKESMASLILVVSVITATAAFIPIGITSSKIGRKKSILYGVVLLTAAFAVTSLYRSYSPLFFVIFAVAGIAWACINVNSLPMVLEISKSGNVGKYTGYYYTFSMAAQVITPILSGIMLERFGYFTLFPYGSVFIGLAFFTMLMVKHGDSKPPVPVSKLEVFNAAD